MEQENKQNPTKPEVSEAQNVFVQTYAEDMVKVIGNDTGGLVKKIIHGDEASQEEKKNISPESKKNKLFMWISFVLVILAFITLVFIYSKKETVNTVPVPPQFVPLIFNDDSTNLEVSGMKKDDIAQAVNGIVNATKVTSGEVEGIYPTLSGQAIGLRAFLTLIKSSFAPGDNTLFVQDNFLMGVVNDTATKDFFILMKVRTDSDVFDAMHNWEPNMLTDLHGFFGITQTADNNYLFTKNFDDGIIENKNARILHDTDGNIVLMYIYADDNSVVIADTEDAAHEVMLRLASSRTTQ